MGMASAGQSKYSLCTWDDRKDRVLKREWGNLSLRALAERFNCRVNTIRDHAVRLGLIEKKRHAQA